MENTTVQVAPFQLLLAALFQIWIIIFPIIIIRKLNYLIELMRLQFDSDHESNKDPNDKES